MIEEIGAQELGIPKVGQNIKSSGVWKR